MAKIKKALLAKLAKAKAVLAKKAQAKAKTKHTPWKASQHPAIPVTALKKMKEGTLRYVMYRAWRGYTIARATDDKKKMAYYAEGIDKMKQEMARRGMSDKHNKSFSRKALGPTKEQGKIPKYADGVWLKDGGKIRIISPLKII